MVKKLELRDAILKIDPASNIGNARKQSLSKLRAYHAMKTEEKRNAEKKNAEKVKQPFTPFKNRDTEAQAPSDAFYSFKEYSGMDDTQIMNFAKSLPSDLGKHQLCDEEQSNSKKKKEDGAEDEDKDTHFDMELDALVDKNRYAILDNNNSPTDNLL